MSKLIKRATTAVALLLVPFAVHAQEEAGEQEQEVCKAVIAPVHSGQVLAVDVTFPNPFGEVTVLDVPPESGLTLATDEQISMVKLSAEETAEGEEEATEMARDANVSTFWINTHEAASGTYSVILQNESGDECTAEITIKAENEDSADN